jgi:uncharacterized protein
MKRYTVFGILLGVTLIGVLVWAVGFGPARAFAQTRIPAVVQATQVTASPSMLRTITVVGEGTVKIKPDIARVSIGVETSGATVKVATTEAGEIMNKVIAALKQQGVTEQDMQTSGYNVWTERNMKPDGQPGETTTYRVNNMLTITIRKLDQVGQVMDAAIEAGANVIHSVTFALNDPKSIEAEARDKAITNALAKATELARLNEVQVGQVVSVSEVVGSGGGYYNSNFMDMQAARMGMGGGGPVAPGELELAMRLQVVYAIQ